MSKEDRKIWLVNEQGQKFFIYETEKCDMEKELNETIQRLQEENKKKDKMIDLMAECMAESISCDFINITDIECKNTQCKDCMKRYFNDEAEKQLNKRTRKEKE